MKKLFFILICSWWLMGCETLLEEDTTSAKVSLQLNFKIPPSLRNEELKGAGMGQMEKLMYNTITPSEAGIEKVSLQIKNASGTIVSVEELDVNDMQTSVSLPLGVYSFIVTASNISKCSAEAFGFDTCKPLPKSKPWYMRFQGECTKLVDVHQPEVSIDARLENAVAHFYFGAPEEDINAKVESLYRVYYKQENGEVEKLEMTVPEASDIINPIGTIDPVYMFYGGDSPLMLSLVPMIFKYKGQIYNRWQLGNGVHERQEYEYSLYDEKDMVMDNGFPKGPKPGAVSLENGQFSLDPQTQVFFSTSHHPAYLRVVNKNKQTSITLSTSQQGVLVEINDNTPKQVEALLNVDNVGLSIEKIEMEMIRNGQLTGNVEELKYNGVTLSQAPLVIEPGNQAEVYVSVDGKKDNIENKEISQVGVVLNR